MFGLTPRTRTQACERRANAVSVLNVIVSAFLIARYFKIHVVVLIMPDPGAIF